MEIKGKVHCFFEQSGTFKNEFKKLGIPAEDYDIRNDFCETDHVIDLFAEIDRAYDGETSLFDSIGNDDLVMAFYPCIYFCEGSQICINLNCKNFRKLPMVERIESAIKRVRMRDEYYMRLMKFCHVCVSRGIRMVFENPWHGQGFLLHGNFLKSPDVIDVDRSRRGDSKVKPTGYWFWNCDPTRCETFQKDKNVLSSYKIGPGNKAGICSSARSMIENDYARNFIADFILGRPCGGRPQQQELF